MAALPAILLGLTAIANTARTNQAFAWGLDFANWNGGYGGRNGENIGIGESPGPATYDNGVYAGLQDAVYDHQQGYAYNPAGSCLPCHSQIYWSGFQHGYDKQWNSYNEQTTTRRTSINIYGNGNYVNTNQDSRSCRFLFIKKHWTRTLQFSWRLLFCWWVWKWT